MTVDIKRRISIIETLLNRTCISCMDKMVLEKCTRCSENSLYCTECLLDHISSTLTNLNVIIYELYYKNGVDCDVQPVKDMISYYQDIERDLIVGSIICKNCIDGCQTEIG